MLGRPSPFLLAKALGRFSGAPSAVNVRGCIFWEVETGRLTMLSMLGSVNRTKCKVINLTFTLSQDAHPFHERGSAEVWGLALRGKSQKGAIAPCFYQSWDTFPFLYQDLYNHFLFFGVCVFVKRLEGIFFGGLPLSVPQHEGGLRDEFQRDAKVIVTFSFWKQLE